MTPKNKSFWRGGTSAGFPFGIGFLPFSGVIMAIRTFPPLLLLLPLMGCFADQKSRLAACEKGAAQSPFRNAPGEPFKQIQACMDRAGYRFIGWNDGVVCDMGSVVKGQPSASGSDAECFEPKSWWALRIYRIEVPSKGQRATG